MKVSEDHFTKHNASVAVAALGPAHGCWHFSLPTLSGSCQGAAGNCLMLPAQGERWELNQPSAAGGANVCYLVIPEMKEALHFWQHEVHNLEFNNTGDWKAGRRHTVSLAYTSKRCFSFGGVNERWKPWFRSIHI